MPPAGIAPLRSPLIRTVEFFPPTTSCELFSMPSHRPDTPVSGTFNVGFARLLRFLFRPHELSPCGSQTQRQSLEAWDQHRVQKQEIKNRNSLLGWRLLRRHCIYATGSLRSHRDADGKGNTDGPKWTERPQNTEIRSFHSVPRASKSLLHQGVAADEFLVEKFLGELLRRYLPHSRQAQDP